MAEEKLKNCPCCGSDDPEEIDYGATKGNEIRCTMCGLSTGEYLSHGSVVGVWNELPRRTPGPPARCEKCEHWKLKGFGGEGRFSRGLCYRYAEEDDDGARSVCGDMVCPEFGED